MVAFNGALIVQMERLRPGLCVDWIAKCRNCDVMRTRAEAACVGQVEELSETVGGADALFTARREADRAGCRCDLDHSVAPAYKLTLRSRRCACAPSLTGWPAYLACMATASFCRVNRGGNRDQLENARIRTVHGT